MIIPALNIAGIITALRGNGGRLVRGAVDLLLLRDEMVDPLRAHATRIAWGMVRGKAKLTRRVQRRYQDAKGKVEPPWKT